MVDAGPEADQAGREIDAGHEAVHVVEPRRRVGLAEDHLQRAAEDRDGGDEEEAHLGDVLAERQGRVEGHGVIPVAKHEQGGAVGVTTSRSTMKPARR